MTAEGKQQRAKENGIPVCVCVNLLAVLYSSRLVKVQTNGTACGCSSTIFAAVLEYPTEAEAFIIGDRQVCLTPGESQV